MLTDVSPDLSACIITQASFQLFERRVLQTEMSEASHHAKMNNETVTNVINKKLSCRRETARQLRMST